MLVALIILKMSLFLSKYVENFFVKLTKWIDLGLKINYNVKK